MPDEDEEKMKKMRVRIERDAYSVLLSFKDGASPRQVEQRMDDTLGYTYNSKYHLAGVYDMSEILRDHPQVRKTFDGKFKIIANEDNHDLVALIAKQNDKKRKKGGNAGRGGRRAATSMGYHPHKNGFGQGLALKSSPKTNNGMRPASSMTKYSNQKVNTFNQKMNTFNQKANTFHPKPNTLHQKPLPSSFNVSRPTSSAASSAAFSHFSILLPKYGVSNNSANRTFTFGTTQKNDTVPAKSSAPLSAFPGQRPLMRPSTASSVAHTSISQNSTLSDTTLVQSSPSSPSSFPSSHMPSIKEFTDNAKNMMLNIHPGSIHLSEMTDLYSQEYGVSVEPLQLFSKSWMNLVKTTFKDWLQMNEGEVSLNPEWFRNHGAVLKRLNTFKQKTSEKSNALFDLNRSALVPIQKVVIPKKIVSAEPSDPFSPSNPTLPSIQGFRYQLPPQPKVLDITEKMKGLTMGTRQTLRTPEKPPGLVKTSEKRNSKLELFPSEKKPSSLTPLSNEPVKRVLSVPWSTATPHYDARQLRNLKFVEKPKDLMNDVETALNGKDTPQLKKIAKKTFKSVGKPNDLASNASFSSKCDVKVPVNSTTNSISDQQKPQTPKESLYTVPSVSTPAATLVVNIKNEGIPTTKSESDDGWGSPTPSNKRLAAPMPPTSSRKILLPPMSKGASSKIQDRSRPDSISKSHSSMEGLWLEKALDATLPDDDIW